METPELTAFVARFLHDQECPCREFENQHSKIFVDNYTKLAERILDQFVALVTERVTGFANGGIPHQVSYTGQEPNLQTSAEAIADVLSKHYARKSK